MPMNSVEGDISKPSEPAQTFLFADLAGFTALTEAHGDLASAELAGSFVDAVRKLLPDTGCGIVKTIGDEVMVRTDNAGDALELGCRIVDRLATHGSPPVRVGIHSGPAVEVKGDWFGASVNLASRVSSVARPGEVLVTQATRDLLEPERAQSLTVRGERYFKHVQRPVFVYAASAAKAGHELEIDPVCRMAVDPASTSHAERHKGREFHFCSVTCAKTFALNPRRFLGSRPRARAARTGFIRHLRIFAAAQVGFALAWAVNFALGGSEFPWFSLILLGWGIPLALHYRAVRLVL